MNEINGDLQDEYLEIQEADEELDGFADQTERLEGGSVWSTARRHPRDRE